MANNRIIFSLFLLLFSRSYAQQISPPAPYGALPSAQQVKWKKMEYYMFIHFGPNTFTDKEWGHGDEDPKVFNPKKLDAKQWAKTAKAAGMKGIIITAKHHDGFCLWPSKFSTHTVRESAWKDGKGDVLKELSEACKAYGLKFGVYLSPWDRNHPEYGTPGYNDIFAKTLKEVLTNYGEVFEQWFDGANGEGPSGRKQKYNWPLFHDVVYKNQPQAIIFSDIGPGCRWVGNESGFAGLTNWSTLNTDGFGMGVSAPSTKVLNEGNEDGKYWIPAECDVSIRPGWFYSPSTNNQVKSVQQLLDIYYASVGRNSNFLLNVPVDRDGLIHPNDSTRLMELKRALDNAFKTNLALGKKVTVSNTRGAALKFGSQQLTDGNDQTYWAANDEIETANVTVDLGKITAINRIVLQEYIPLGQRIKSFSVDYWDGKAYKQFDKQTTVGFKRILTFPTLRTSKIRINILETKASPVLSEIQIYKAPELISDPLITRSKRGVVTIANERPNTIITYTMDGSEPGRNAKRFTEPFNFSSGGMLKAKAFMQGEHLVSGTVTANFDISPAKWQLVTADSEAAENSAKFAFDADPGTSWLSASDSAYPHQISIDLGEKITLKGFTYVPSLDAKTAGLIYKYNFYRSADGKNWQKVIDQGEFSNIKNNPFKQEVRFKETVDTRYIKFEAIASANEDDRSASVGEIEVLTR
ncbi:MAG: alpha-L-fucosidase [Sphingobacteriaceae bacterium]